MFHNVICCNFNPAWLEFSSCKQLFRDKSTDKRWLHHNAEYIFISFGIIEPIPVILKIKYRFKCMVVGVYSLINDLLCIERVFKPLKCQENLHLKMSSVYVVCWIFLQVFQTYFCIQANSVDPDQTAPRGAVWSGSTLFAEMTFKITSRWQSRRQLLWLAV